MINLTMSKETSSKDVNLLRNFAFFIDCQPLFLVFVIFMFKGHNIFGSNELFSDKRL